MRNSYKLLIMRVPCGLGVRLVYSVLAFKSRYGFGATLNQLHNWTRLSATTISVVLDGLCSSGLVRQEGKEWFANDPPTDYIVERAGAKDQHWYDRAAYLAIEMIDGLSPIRCCILAYLKSKAKQAKSDTVCGVTINGIASLFDVESKTVSNALAALDASGYIDVAEDHIRLRAEPRRPQATHFVVEQNAVESLCSDPYRLAEQLGNVLLGDVLKAFSEWHRLGTAADIEDALRSISLPAEKRSLGEIDRLVRDKLSTLQSHRQSSAS